MNLTKTVSLYAICILISLVFCACRETLKCPTGTDLKKRDKKGGLEHYCTIKAKDGSEMMHGGYISWHSNNKKSAEGTWKNGNPSGKWTYWYRTGRKEAEGELVDGKQHGAWTWWYPNGMKKAVVLYTNGKTVSIKQWDDRGVPR